MNYYVIQPNDLTHHGILGQKWGIRRFQYENGSLTAAGKKRYYKAESKINKIEAKREKKRKRFEKDKARVSKIFGKDTLMTKYINKKLAYGFDETEIKNKFAIAKQKAKQDPSYKNTDEYKRLKSARTEQFIENITLGPAAHMTVASLEKDSHMNKAAAIGVVFVGNVAFNAASLVISKNVINPAVDKLVENLQK